MNRQNEIIATLKKEMNLEIHSAKCTSIFKKYIKISRRDIQKIMMDDIYNGHEFACYIEEYDDYGFQLSIIQIKPRLDTGWGDILGKENGSDFFDNRVFLPWERQNEIKELASKKYDVDEDEDWDAYWEFILLPMDEIVQAWLCMCWQEANKNENTAYPCYMAHHDDGFETALNLLDGSLNNLNKLTQ